MQDIHSEKLTAAIPDVVLLPDSKRDTTTLHEIYERLYGRWVFILICTLVTLGLAIVYLESASPLYTAQMAIAPPMQSNSDRTGGMLSSLGELAGLALGSESGAVSAPFLRYEKMLTSREVATRLVRDHQLLQIVFSVRWDPIHQTWKPPRSLAGRLNAVLNSMFGRPAYRAPDVADLQYFLTKHLDIEVPAADAALSPAPAMRYVQFRFRDPRVASEMLLWLQQETDAVIREEELNRTRVMISYLDKRLQTTTEIDERTSLAELLLDQERAEMLLTTGLDYAAEVIDPPGVPEEPSYPKIQLTLLLGLISGLLIGSLIAISRQHGNAERDRSARKRDAER